MYDLLFKAAFGLGVLAIGAGVAIAAMHAYNAWRNKYRDHVTTWLHSHCRNERVRRILLKAIHIVDNYAGKVLRVKTIAEKENGTQEIIETHEISVDVAKGAGLITNDQINNASKELFDDSETATMLGLA